MKTTDYPRPYFERDSFFPLETSGESSFVLPDKFSRGIVLLNSEGRGRLIFNGHKITGGACADVTQLLSDGCENTLCVDGNFDSVWLESVPKKHIKSISVTPSLCERKLRFEFELSERIEVSVEVFVNGRTAAVGSTMCGGCELALSEVLPWTPSEPIMYEAIVTAGQDIVKYSFCMRETGIIRKNDNIFFSLNGKAYFPIGIAQADAAVAKFLGFDMIMAYGAVSEAFKWECDKTGLLLLRTERADADADLCGVSAQLVKRRSTNGEKVPIGVFLKARPRTFLKKCSRSIMKKRIAAAVVACPSNAFCNGEFEAVKKKFIDITK